MTLQMILFNTPEFLRQVINMGMLRYSPEKIINVLDIEAQAAEFIKEFNRPGSDIFNAYKKGIDKADYLIDHKLYTMATNGDLKALAALQDRYKPAQELTERQRNYQRAISILNKDKPPPAPAQKPKPPTKPTRSTNKKVSSNGNNKPALARKPRQKPTKNNDG